ncbi:MAG: TrkH family potassium uptake protein, partial [Chitinispirillaceae bacterium]
MNYRFVFYSIGKLLQILGLILFVPASIAWYETSGPFMVRIFSPQLFGFILGILLSILVGTLLVMVYRKNRGRIDIREGFAIVTFSWLALTLVGAVPLFVYFQSTLETSTAGTLFGAFTDAFFEVMSGLTTTGATILTEVESLPRGILFWRSLTHWLGGMGIVTLALALFPTFGVAAYQLFRGEVPGPSKERLRPRLAQTAIILWGVYALLTFVQTILLMAGNMDLFDAITHAFATMATGGFSTRNSSIASFDSAYIEWIVIVFMILAGTNFLIHYRVIFHSDFTMVKQNREFHFYLVVMGIAAVLCIAILSFKGLQSSDEVQRNFRSDFLTSEQAREKLIVEKDRLTSAHDVVRQSVFQVVSITTTTGFTTADWDVWPDFARLMLVILMFFGGSAGSTAGGLKMIRILVLLKVAFHHAKVMIQPRLVSPVKIGGQVLKESQMSGIISFFILFIILFVIASALMATMIPDVTTAVTSVVASLGNIGPGLAGVGALETYSWIPIPGKWVLIVCMLLGRLEIYTVLIAFSPV